jgi:hypothetical protein
MHMVAAASNRDKSDKGNVIGLIAYFDTDSMVAARGKVAQRSNNRATNKRTLELDESKYWLSGLVDCTNTFCWQQLAYNC